MKCTAGRPPSCISWWSIGRVILRSLVRPLLVARRLLVHFSFFIITSSLLHTTFPLYSLTWTVSQLSLALSNKAKTLIPEEFSFVELCYVTSYLLPPRVQNRINMNLELIQHCTGTNFYNAVLTLCACVSYFTYWCGRSSETPKFVAF